MTLTPGRISGFENTVLSCCWFFFYLRRGDKFRATVARENSNVKFNSGTRALYLNSLPKALHDVFR